MATSPPLNQPPFRPLAELLPKNDAGDSEFDQIVLVLLRLDASQARRRGKRATPSRLGPGLWLVGRTLCICHPPSQCDGANYDQLLDFANQRLKGLGTRRQPTRLVVAQPDAVADTASGTNSDFQKYIVAMQKTLPKECTTTWWDAAHLKEMLVAIPPLGLHYYPEFLPNGIERQQVIIETRKRYNREFLKLHGKIQFVGMSVYKEEASASVDMDRIYIRLQVVPEGAVESDTQLSRTDPLTLLTPGARHVILGDPGSGKSTLLRFLALAGNQPQLMKRYGAQKDDRLPVLVTLRRYADELKSRPGLSLLDHILELTRGDLGLSAVATEFFDYHLWAGQAIILLDGLDELPSPHFKTTVRDRVAELQSYPGNTTVVTSRIVGYDKEVRYDGLGFSHHRVARLSFEDIAGFVTNWYEARLENTAERQRHATDLSRIINDPDNRAIRELAENPLLLTIICLVHRIDAVLPDERVVLYQKCTETLLNTWHAWKFHSEETRSRNKVEQRNRSRMEAIAYWMHCLMGEEGSTQRAVVPYADLRDFLSQYISEIEKPSHDDSRTLAEEFLYFVKDRAGLLIEAGDELYSFVHLTFQEYLTATYLRKSGETGGVGVIWECIEERCGDRRWHEVIRLLVGALERRKSQEYLLKRIVPEEENDQYLQRAVLAGGCLIDSVDATEDMHEEILDSLLKAAAMADSVESLRGPLGMLRTWQDRDSDNRQILARLVRQADRDVTEDSLRIGLALNLVSLGWSDEEVRLATKRLHDLSTREGQIYAASLMTEERPIFTPLLAGDQELVRRTLAEYCVTTRLGNFAAMVLASLSPTRNTEEPCPPFWQILSCLRGFHGPFEDQVRFCILSQDVSGDNVKGAKIRALALRKARLRDPFENARSRGLWQSLGKALEGIHHPRSLEQPLEQFPRKGRERVLNRILLRTPERLQFADLVKYEEFWKSSESNPTLYSPTLETLCDLLNLTPQPQWWEAIRMRGLPQVPRRITLADPGVWQRTEEAFASHHASEADCLHGASQLLFDVWLWFAGAYDHPDKSQFASLVRLTRGVDAPPLRVAHCIRDLAYGDESREDDLVAMVHSTEPGYRRLFEEAFWHDPADLRGFTRAKQRRKR
jgi:NACHT domain